MDEPHGTDIPRSPLRISKPVPPLYVTLWCKRGACGGVAVLPFHTRHSVSVLWCTLVVAEVRMPWTVESNIIMPQSLERTACCVHDH